MAAVRTLTRWTHGSARDIADVLENPFVTIKMGLSNWNTWTYLYDNKSCEKLSQPWHGNIDIPNCQVVES